MKKTLAMILSIALALSLLTVGFVFTASADATLPDIDALWAAEEAAWAPTVYLAENRYVGADSIAINDGETLQLTADNNGHFPYSGGTVTLENGVLYLSNLVREPGTEDKCASIVAHGAVKIVLAGEYQGTFRNDYGTPGSLFITADETVGGYWSCPAHEIGEDKMFGYNEHNVRFDKSLYIYGNLGFDVYGPIRYDNADTDSNYEVYLAPEKDSTWTTWSGGDKSLFIYSSRVWGAVTPERMIFAGGANITINGDGEAATLFPDAHMTDFVVDNANVTYNAEFGEAGGDDFAGLIPAITVRNGGSLNLTNIYAGAENAILAKVEAGIDETSAYYVNGELQVGTAPAEPEAPEFGLESESSDITLNYQEMTPNTEASYSVDVAWTDIAFTYHAPAAGQWNPQTHQYDNAAAGRWDAEADNITVTNNSNVEVEVTVSVDNTTTADIRVDSDETPYEKTVEIAAAGAFEIFTLTPNGTIASDENGTAVATATVTFAAVEPDSAE